MNDDANLVASIARGDSSALELLYERHSRGVYSLAVRLLSDGPAAEEVVQETFLSAYQSLDSFKGDALFFTWLFRIAYNNWISARRKRRVVLSIDIGREEGTGVEPEDLSEFGPTSKG